MLFSNNWHKEENSMLTQDNSTNSKNNLIRKLVTQLHWLVLTRKRTLRFTTNGKFELDRALCRGHSTSEDICCSSPMPERLWLFWAGEKTEIDLNLRYFLIHSHQQGVHWSTNSAARALDICLAFADNSPSETHAYTPVTLPLQR